MEDLSIPMEQPSKDIENSESGNKKSIMLLVACMVLGVICNILFYQKSLGVSYPIFVLCFYGVFLWTQRDNLKVSFDFGWLLSIPIVMLSLTYLIFSNMVFWVLNFMAIPILIVAQTILLSKTNSYSWFQAKFLKDILKGIFSRTLSYIPRPFKIFADFITKKTSLGKYNTLNKVLLGLLISLPLVFVVVSLLTSADQVFSDLVSNIPRLFENIKLGEFISRLLFILIVGMVSFSYLWSFLQQEPKTVTEEMQKGMARILDTVIVITVLVSINLIYLVFTSIQFAYLFGGNVPDGFTYAEYARRGFFELVLVTLINLVILLCNVNLRKDGGKVLNITVQVLNTLLVACTAVMLVSAHYRMLLYEEAYGYTYLRVLTHAFMAFILVLLIIALVKVWNKKVVLLRAYIITALAAYVLINYANIDIIIAGNNLKRYEASHKIDANYISHLSYDTVPLIIHLLDDQDKQVSMQVENGLFVKKQNISESYSWQSFNITKYNAGKILAEYDLKYRDISTMHEK